MTNDKITLNFEIEKGESIDQYYFSARMKLTDESKNLLREKLGNTVQFDNLDNYFNLNHENFYIYYNKYSEHNGRSELYVKGDNGKYLTSNLPLNHYGFSVELSSDGSSIADYGFYPLSVIYNPGHYNKAKEKKFDDHDELLPIVLNVLDNLFRNGSNLTTQEIFSQLQNEIAEKEAKLAREKRQAEEELSRKNEQLKELIEKGEISLFKVIKGHDIGNGHSSVVLQLTKDGREALGVNSEDITLDHKKFYVAEYEGSEFLHFANSDHDMLLGYDDLFFVLNKSSYAELESGFYTIYDLNPNSYAQYLDTKFSDNKFIDQDEIQKILSKLDDNFKDKDEDIVEVIDVQNEQPNQEIAVESGSKPREKRETKEEIEREERQIGRPDLDAKDSHGYTALHKAVFSKRFDEVKSLVEQGANVDVQDKHEITPLSYAVMNNDGTMVRFLIEKGNASVNLGKYNNPLSMAISREYTELAEYLIKKGADVNHQNSIGRTLLHKTAEDGNLAMVKFLVEKGARLDILDEWNDTPLHIAANVKVNKGHVEVAEYLIQKGADINLTYNYTPIHLAITRGNLDMVKCLIDNGADLYVKRACDGTPLAYAKQQGQTEIVKYMDSVMSNLLHNKTVSFDGADISIKYDLANNKLGMIEKSIKDAMQDFKSAFNTSGHHREVNVYVFNTRDDYKAYLKKVGVDIGDGAVGYTKMINLSKGDGADIYVYLDSRGNLDQYVLEHEAGHAMHFTNLGLSYILPKAMHEAIANYTAGLENGEHVNDHEDIKALSAIKSKDLKPDEILRNDYQGEYYYSEAEQVVKFLEYKHPDLIDNLLKSLSAYGYSDKTQAKKLVEDFLTTLKDYDQEFKGWVKDQLVVEERLQHKEVEVNEQHIDTPNDKQTDKDQGKVRTKRVVEEDEIEKSVIGSMNEDSDSKVENFNEVGYEPTEIAQQHPLKIKTGSILEVGKYKVELQVTYDDVTNFYDTIKNKYHTSKEYNYEQVMVLYNNIITPASQHYEEPITLAESYIANGHLFIQNQDFGTLDDFNEMFYKSDELLG